MSGLRTVLEILGGARPLPDALVRFRGASLLTGLWWACLLLLVLGFAGRTAKFIYIDF